MVRASRLGRGASFFQNAVIYQVALGRFAAADSTLARYAAKSPSSPVLLALRAEMSTARQDYAAAIRLFLQLRAAQASSPVWQAGTSFELSRLSRLTGRLADTERYLRANMQVLESLDQAGAYVERASELAMLESEMRGRPDSAMATLAAALNKYPLAGIAPLNRPYVALVIAYVRMGNPSEARRVWKEYESALPESVRRGDQIGQLAAGMLAEADHHPGEAESHYRNWYAGSGECGPCGLFELAKLADAAGRTDSALALYDRGITVPALPVFGTTPTGCRRPSSARASCMRLRAPRQGRRPLPPLRGAMEGRRSRAAAGRARGARAIARLATAPGT